MSHQAASLNQLDTTWALSQYKDSLSRYGDFHHEDKMVKRPSYLYNGNSSCSDKMTSSYWDGPQAPEWPLPFPYTSSLISTHPSILPSSQTSCLKGQSSSFLMEAHPRNKTFNSLRLRQNGRYNADDIFKCIFLNENVWFPTTISLKFVPKDPINNIQALVLIMAWRRPGDKPLSEPMMVSLPTHIYVTRPQWVNKTFYTHSKYSRNPL